MPQYVTTGEFERHMALLQKSIDDGFAVTHDLQRQTNGRVLKAESDIRKLDEEVRDIKRSRRRVASWGSAAKHVALAVISGLALFWLKTRLFGLAILAWPVR